MKYLALLLLAGVAVALVILLRAGDGPDVGAGAAAEAPLPESFDLRAELVDGEVELGRVTVEGAEPPRLQHPSLQAPEDSRAVRPRPIPYLTDEHLPPEAQVEDVEEGEVLRARFGDGRLRYLGTQVLVAEGTYEREGGWEAWHPNGALHELGAYRRDIEHGLWKWWHEDGTPQAVGEFDEGTRIGTWNYWYENGNRMMDSQYENGVPSGLWTYYWENGVKRTEGEFVDGELHGYWTVWDESGRFDPERSGTYVHGVRQDD